MLVEGDDVKFVANTKSSHEHTVNALSVVFFYAAMRKASALLFIMKFSRLTLKDTMMLGVLNFAEYL